jgi:hypothetical protein
MERDIVERLRWWGVDGVAGERAMLVEAAAKIEELRSWKAAEEAHHHLLRGEIETLRAALGARYAEIAAVRRELSDMATKYSWAVDTFNTGFSGYEAVLLHQKRIAEEGPPSMWRGPMRDYAARANIGKDKGNE